MNMSYKIMYLTILYTAMVSNKKSMELPHSKWPNVCMYAKF